MPYLWRIPFFSVVALFFLIIGCANPKPPGSSPIPKQPPVSRASSTSTQTPKTLAIFNFENNSITDSARYAPLEKGIPAMLITDLSRSAPSLRLIERSRISAILKETAFTQMGGVDESAAVQAGKLLGAESIAFGSFMVLGDQVRIDSRLIGLETPIKVQVTGCRPSTEGPASPNSSPDWTGPSM